MRRAFVLLLTALTACARHDDDAGPRVGTYAGAGRDRLCIARDGDSHRAGIVSYGAGDSNCTMAGALTRDAQGWRLVPRGEGACSVALATIGDLLSVAAVPAACAYYCAPGASLVGKRFTFAEKATSAVDLAGDPLC